MKRICLLAALAMTSCVSAIDKPAAAANLANVTALVAENSTYTAADSTLPASLKLTRDARNSEAIRLAGNLAK